MKIKKYIYDQVASVLKICIFIIENNSFDIYGFSNNDEDKNKKFVIIYKHDEFYFPVINWETKYYDHNSSFVTELLNKYNIMKKKIIKFYKEDKEELHDIVENNNISDDDLDDLDDKNEYKEFISNHKSAVFMSEALSTNIKNKKDKKSSEKIKKSSEKIKKSSEKNVFIEKIKKSSEKDVFIEKIDDDSIHNTSVIVTKIDKNKIIKDTKISLKLETLQENALKLGLMIVHKDSKTGKLKNKTKSDLYDEIKNIK